MATTAKSNLRSVLSQTELIDPQGLTPFVALHLGDPTQVHVRRTGAVGYVETDGAPNAADPGWAYVTYDHLQDCLRFIESDDVEIQVLSHGGVALRAVNSPFDTELRVHTVPATRSGFKRHDVGPVYRSLEPGWLSGLNVKPLPLTAPPVLHGDRIVLTTASGLVVWTAAYDPEVPSFPRGSFLRAIADTPDSSLDLTERGFYHAQLGTVHLYTAGHQVAALMAGPLLGKASDTTVSLPAGRLVQALKAAVSLAAQGAEITINPRTGVTTRDVYSNPARWALGDVPPFAAMAVTPKTAKLLADALEQTTAPVALLANLLGHPDVFRITRGGCEVSFRTVPTR